jgi:hypothetical protein
MRVNKLLEMNAIAAFGNWEPGIYSLGFLSETGLFEFYDKISDIRTPIGNMELYKMKSNHHYVLGKFETKDILTKRGKEKETKLDVIFKMTLTPVKSVGESFLNVDEVQVRENVRCYGIALQMYRYFLKVLKHQLMGDEVQYFGARKLWAKISAMTDVTVDLIDIAKDVYIEKNIVVHQGKEDWDYDTRVWGNNYSSEKKDVRLILKDL